MGVIKPGDAVMPGRGRAAHDSPADVVVAANQAAHIRPPAVIATSNSGGCSGGDCGFSGGSCSGGALPRGGAVGLPLVTPSAGASGQGVRWNLRPDPDFKDGPWVNELPPVKPDDGFKLPGVSSNDTRVGAGGKTIVCVRNVSYGYKWEVLDQDLTMEISVEWCAHSTERNVTSVTSAFLARTCEKYTGWQEVQWVETTTVTWIGEGCPPPQVSTRVLDGPKRVAFDSPKVCGRWQLMRANKFTLDAVDELEHILDLEYSLQMANNPYKKNHGSFDGGPPVMPTTAVGTAKIIQHPYPCAAGASPLPGLTDHGLA